MAWKPVQLSEAELRASAAERRRARRTRFLVDESLGARVAEVIMDRGYRADFALEVGLGGHSDEDVFAWAWKKNRVLLTHDTDFLEDRRFPEHRNAGVIVLPGGGGNEDDLIGALLLALAAFGRNPGRCRGMKAHFTHGNMVKLRERNVETGLIEERRFRFRRDGTGEFWEEDQG